MAVTPRRPALELPELAAHDGAPLVDDADHDRIAFDGVELDGHQAQRTRFTECSFDGAALGDLRLRATRMHDVLFSRCQSSNLDVVGSAWRDVVIDRCRFGAFVAYDTSLARVEVRASKLSFMSLRGARLTDVRIEGTDIAELDLSSASLERVELAGCSVDRLVVDGTTMVDVDISTSRISEVVAVDGLRGATLGWGQLVQLAPTMASHLGIEVAEQ